MISGLILLSVYGTVGNFYTIAIAGAYLTASAANLSLVVLARDFNV